MQMVTWDTMVAVMVYCCGSMLASVVQIATLLQNASLAWLLLVRKWSRSSHRPILSSSFCNGVRIHRSECCQC